MSLPQPRFRCTSPLHALVLVCFLPLAVACGAGAGGTRRADDGMAPEPGAGLDRVAVSPLVVDAAVNARCTILGGTFTAPVVCRILDGSGALVGPARAGTVSADGTRVEVSTPILPELAEPLDVVVEVRDGAGRVARGRRTMRIEPDAFGARAIDGSGNNLADDTMGQAGAALRADVPRAYADGASEPAGADRPGVREISNIVCAQSEDMAEPSGASDLFWLFGQFLDHDLDLTGEAEPQEAFDIPIPLGDPYFDPLGTGSQTMPFHRSAWLAGTGTDPGNPRLQPNEITSWIDASTVYGSDAARASALRTNDGTGRLRTGANDMLPFNTTGLANAPTAFDPSFFLAGDVRANENVLLTAMHTVWMREHNRTADALRSENPHLSGDQIYEASRRRVGALMQAIVDREFLPVLLGPDALGPYRGYDPAVDASVGVLFSTAAYRFGHTMVSDTLLLLDADGNEAAGGSLGLRNAFFDPTLLDDADLIDDLLRGAAARTAQAVDARVVDGLRNFLFGPPGAGGLDLAALNLQRGRDHGLPDYNTVRRTLGLAPVATFEAVSSDPDLVERLRTAYGQVEGMDVWVAVLCEDRLPGALVGETLHRSFVDAFRRLRDGDRFWYENQFRGEALDQLRRTRLADVIRRNTGIGDELSDRVLAVAQEGGRPPPQRGNRGPLTQVQLEALARGRLFR